MRLLNRVLATLAAAALVAAGVVLVVEVVVGYYLERRPWLLPHDRWYTDARGTTWADRTVLFIFVLIGLGGLALLVLQFVRRRPSGLPLVSDRDDIHAEVSRRSVERTLVRAAERVDGVASATARVRRQRAAVRVTTERRVVGDLRVRVARAADAVLDDLGLVQRPAVEASVNGRRIVERAR